MIKFVFSLFMLLVLTAGPQLINAQQNSDAKSSKQAVTKPFLEESESNKELNSLSWTLVDKLSDEFDGETINDTKWQTEPYQNGWVWVGRPPGLFRASNVSVADGMMKVIVSKLPKPIKKRRSTFLYQGAIVRSKSPGKPGWYYETRMKANATEMSSTFWLMTPGNAPKKLELDIQECVGRVSENAEKWSRNFDNIFHSNMIQRKTRKNAKVQIQGAVETPTKNHERFYVYGCWWKSPDEVQFFLDGKYVYSIKPNVSFDVPSYLQMAIETYDWNPVPKDGGLIASGTEEQRTTSYDWIRVWKQKTN